MTSLHQAFKNAKLKVERGDHHIREYTQTIIAFLQTDFCKVTVEEDGETGNYLVKVDATAPYPPALPTIIGDAAHNLRTAIDYIIVEFTGLDPDWISLPVGKERGEVEASPKYQAICRKCRSLPTSFSMRYSPTREVSLRFGNWQSLTTSTSTSSSSPLPKSPPFSAWTLKTTAATGLEIPLPPSKRERC